MTPTTPADGLSHASEPEADRRALERAETVAHLLDEAVRIPVLDYRIGLDPILGLLPVSGDAVAAVGSLYVVLQGLRVGVPPRQIAAMLLLIGVEFVVGSVPVLGSILDAVVKINRRNVRVIESHVEETP